MAFKDHPYFRRILELDDLIRQGKRVTATTLAAKWEACDVEALYSRMKMCPGRGETTGSACDV